MAIMLSSYHSSEATRSKWHRANCSNEQITRGYMDWAFEQFRDVMSRANSKSLVVADARKAIRILRANKKIDARLADNMQRKLNALIA